MVAQVQGPARYKYLTITPTQPSPAQLSECLMQDKAGNGGTASIFASRRF